MTSLHYFWSTVLSNTSLQGSLQFLRGSWAPGSLYEDPSQMPVWACKLSSEECGHVSWVQRRGLLGSTGKGPQAKEKARLGNGSVSLRVPSFKDLRPLPMVVSIELISAPTESKTGGGDPNCSLWIPSTLPLLPTHQFLSQKCFLTAKAS